VAHLCFFIAISTDTVFSHCICFFLTFHELNVATISIVLLFFLLYIPERSFMYLVSCWFLISLFIFEFPELGGGQCGKKNLLHFAVSLSSKAKLCALEARVHNNYCIYGPMIYTAPCAFDAGKSITRASGRGLGPENRDYGIEPWGECHLVSGL
jgi:hypothetical protein